MSPIHTSDPHVPQETSFDDGADQAGIAQPYTQSEMEELLYGEDRPVQERLARLRDLRSELGNRESADWGNEDPASLLDEIDRALLELDTDDADDYASLASGYSIDPADHSETLSPDDDALTAEDDADTAAEVLDDSEWQDGDGFQPDRGVH